ncbi:MAG: hypothetical protein ACTSRI_13875 [Promethearchaeota archaeon]
MTEVSQEEFLIKLFEVICKLSSIAKIQSPRFLKKWDEYLKTINDKPNAVRHISLDKDYFLKDIDYRISVLKTVEQSLVDGFNSIKKLLNALYGYYFDSKLFKGIFSEEDQVILKYLVAKEILGNLIQYNKMDHETVPLKFNIIARNYSLLKILDQGQENTEVLDNLKKLNINMGKPKLNKIMQEIEKDGIITIIKKGENYVYKLKKELKLSKEGTEQYQQSLLSLIEWPTQFWRSYYNVRELNVTLDKDCNYRDFLSKVLAKTATQGYIATQYVFKNLIKYYEKIKEEAT